LWCYSSGNAPTIENADRAVATTAKLSVGSYSFKLVVKDGEGLTSEDVVEIQVKEGNKVMTIILTAYFILDGLLHIFDKCRF